MPGHGAQINARAPTKGHVQTDNRAGAPSLNGAFSKVEEIGYYGQTSGGRTGLLFKRKFKLYSINF